MFSYGFYARLIALNHSVFSWLCCKGSRTTGLPAQTISKVGGSKRLRRRKRRQREAASSSSSAGRRGSVCASRGSQGGFLAKGGRVGLGGGVL